MSDRNETAKLLREAGYIGMAQRVEAVTPEEQAAFDDWLADPENKACWDEAIADARDRLSPQRGSPDECNLSA